MSDQSVVVFSAPFSLRLLRILKVFSVSTVVISCDFEDETFCGMTQLTSPITGVIPFPWLIGSGFTFKPNTGPSGGNNGL